MNRDLSGLRRPRLSRADRWLASCWAVLCLPILWWFVRIVNSDWIPHGDLAVAAIKIHDVFSADPPLLGMPTTSGIAVPGNTAHHPGPLQFYLLAPGYQLTGESPTSLIIGSALIMLVLVWLALWAARDAYGSRGLIVIVVALAVTLVGMGLHTSIPWNPWPASIASIAAFAAAWAILRGHQRWWVGFVFASALAAQSHLSFGPLMVIVGVVLVVVTVLDVRRHGLAEGDPNRWAAGLAVLGIVWLPPIINQFLVSPGNLSEILDYASASGGGASWIIYVAGVSAVLWVLSRRDVTLTSGRPTAFIPLLIIGWAVTHWSIDRSAEGLSGSSYADAPWILFLAWWLAIPLWRLARRWPAPTLVAGLAVALVTALGVDSIGLRTYDASTFDVELARVAVSEAEHRLATLDADLPVEVRTQGGAAWGGVGPAVCAALVVDGHDVHCGDGWTLGREGDHRHVRHLEGERIVVYLESGAETPEGDSTTTVVGFSDLREEFDLPIESAEDWLTITVFEEDPADSADNTADSAAA